MCIGIEGAIKINLRSEKRKISMEVFIRFANYRVKDAIQINVWTGYSLKSDNTEADILAGMHLKILRRNQ